MNAIAVLANEPHLPYVRQIICSSYLRGNWRGEYILIAHQIKNSSALQWFHDRGIHVHHTSGLAEPNPSFPETTSIYYSKIELFHPFFRRWDTIVYLDTDMIVRKDLNRLLKYGYFAAADDCARFPLIHQFLPRQGKPTEQQLQTIKAVLSDYDLEKTAFNAGMMVIDSKNNTRKRYDALCALVKKLGPYSTYGDQGVLNVYFQKTRKRIPYVYNDFYQSDDFNRKGLLLRKNDKDAVILHLTYPYKPWDDASEYLEEWRSFDAKADDLFDIESNGCKPSFFRTLWVDFINAFHITLLKRGW